MLINYMEIAVDHIMPSILAEYENICKCQSCIEDIKALTLNNLKPLYVVTEKGYTYTKVNELKTQFNVDIINEIMKSIVIVSAKPRHCN